MFFCNIQVVWIALSYFVYPFYERLSACSHVFLVSFAVRQGPSLFWTGFGQEWNLSLCLFLSVSTHTKPLPLPHQQSWENTSSSDKQCQLAIWGLVQQNLSNGHWNAIETFYCNKEVNLSNDTFKKNVSTTQIARRADTTKTGVSVNIDTRKWMLSLSHGILAIDCYVSGVVYF
jgi:hypothetical protein